MAQIAKSIAIRINSTNDFFKRNPVNLDLVEFAGLAHDLGHPPFGHNGEAALDKLMVRHGGFEGNAQTLRLIARIEKKITTEFPSVSQTPRPIDLRTLTDLRLGLNLSYRSLASVLKYDNVIPESKIARELAGSEKKPVKGYYAVESKLVERIKNNVAPGYIGPFKSIECHIMDVADDIAYSTYDLEDAFKANFLTPLSMISKDDSFKERIASKVRENIRGKIENNSEKDLGFDISDVNNILGELFRPLLELDSAIVSKRSSGITIPELSFLIAAHTSAGSQALVEKGYLRTSFTSDLEGRFIRDIV